MYFQKNSTSLRVAIVALAAFGASTAVAAISTANLAVSATVSNNCTITTSALSFGSYDPVSANSSAALNGTGGVSVTCTSGASTTVALGQGANANTGSTDAAPLRRMASGTNRLSYSLYQDAARTAVWGNTVATSVAHTGTGTSTAITVYGAIAGGQNVPAGSYTDTVVATVTF